MEIMNVLDYVSAHPWIVLLLMVWTLPWKGYALWKAARLYHMTWFVVILIVNTFGIVDIAYIFLVARPAEKSLEQK